MYTFLSFPFVSRMSIMSKLRTSARILFCIGVLLLLLLSCKENNREENADWGPGASLSDSTVLEATGSLVVVKDNRLFTFTVPDAKVPLTDILIDMDSIVSFPALSPNGKYVFIPSATSAYVVYTDEKKQIELPINGYVRYPAWSPDSARVAYVTWDGICVSDIDMNGARTETIVSSGSTARYVNWSPDGFMLAFVDGMHLSTFPFSPSDVQDTSRQELTQVTQDGNAYPYLQYDYSPNGTSLAVSDGSDIRISSVNDMTSRAVTIDGYTRFLSWSPDGEYIAVGKQNLWIIDSNNLHTDQLTNFGNLLSVRDGVWSPDSSRIVFGAEIPLRGRGADWWKIYVVNQDGSNLIHLTNDELAATSTPVWSPDGEFILFRGGVEDGLDKIDEKGIYLAKADGSTVALLIPSGQWAAWLPK